MKYKRGITLIVLVITIVVFVVIATAIILSINNSGIFDNTNEAEFKSNASNYQDELTLLINSKYISKEINAKEELNYSSDNIKLAISSIKKSDESKYEIIDGDLIFIGQDSKEIKWAKEIGIFTVDTDSIEIESLELVRSTFNSIEVSTKMDKELSNYKFYYCVLDEEGTEVVSKYNKVVLNTDNDQVIIKSREIKPNTQYTVRVKAKYYNLEVTKELNVTTDNIVPEFTLSNNDYTNDDVEVNVLVPMIPENSKLEIYIDNVLENTMFANASNSEQQYKITMLQNGCITAKIIDINTDEEYATNVQNVSNIDKKDPKVISFDKKDVEKLSFVLTVNAYDQDSSVSPNYCKSGIKCYKFYVNDSLYDTITTNQTTVECSVNKNLTTNTNYNCYVIVEDYAGNENQSNIISVKTKPETYQIIYNDGINDIMTDIKEEGITYTLSSTVPTKNGCIFLNWLGSDGNVYNPSSQYDKDKSITFTAQWKQLQINGQNIVLVGNNIQLSLNDSTVPVTWSSSSPSYASITSDGLVTGLVNSGPIGLITITAQTSYGNITKKIVVSSNSITFPNTSAYDATVWYVTGVGSGGIYGGTTYYTTDSNVAVAAVHAGYLTAGQTKRLTVQRNGTRSSYSAVTNNGITSYAWSSSWACYYISNVQDINFD